MCGVLGITHNYWNDLVANVCVLPGARNDKSSTEASQQLKPLEKGEHNPGDRDESATSSESLTSNGLDSESTSLHHPEVSGGSQHYHRPRHRRHSRRQQQCNASSLHASRHARAPRPRHPLSSGSSHTSGTTPRFHHHHVHLVSPLPPPASSRHVGSKSRHQMTSATASPHSTTPVDATTAANARGVHRTHAASSSSPLPPAPRSCSSPYLRLLEHPGAEVAARTASANALPLVGALETVPVVMLVAGHASAQQPQTSLQQLLERSSSPAFSTQLPAVGGALVKPTEKRASRAAAQVASPILTVSGFAITAERSTSAPGIALPPGTPTLVSIGALGCVREEGEYKGGREEGSGGGGGGVKVP